jgi:hypothetical protein
MSSPLAVAHTLVVGEKRQADGVDTRETHPPKRAKQMSACEPVLSDSSDDDEAPSPSQPAAHKPVLVTVDSSDGSDSDSESSDTESESGSDTNTASAQYKTVTFRCKVYDPVKAAERRKARKEREEASKTKSHKKAEEAAKSLRARLRKTQSDLNKQRKANVKTAKSIAIASAKLTALRLKNSIATDQTQALASEAIDLGGKLAAAEKTLRSEAALSITLAAQDAMARAYVAAHVDEDPLATSDDDEDNNDDDEGNSDERTATAQAH